jgi:caa(3)-type oxidase subunit IV
MSHLRASATTRVWLVLVAATGLTGLTFEMLGRESWATSVILIIAAAKIGLILNYFMEVEAAPRFLKIACGLWLAAVLAIVLIGFAPDVTPRRDNEHHVTTKFEYGGAIGSDPNAT